MNSELSEEIFKIQTKFCSDATLLSVRSWKIVTLSFPRMEVEFSSNGRPPIIIKMLCDEWDDLPPSIDLLDQTGTPLAKFPQGQGHSVFNNSLHPITKRPFLCIPGVREYHEHSSHISDKWDNYKNKSGYDLGGILTRVWSAWKSSQ